MVKTEIAHPGTFDALVICEPILFREDIIPGDRSDLASRAAKRRDQWNSRWGADPSLSTVCTRSLSRVCLKWVIILL